MSPTDQTVTIRSYRLAFALERRIFRIERYRLPLPYGLPLRGLAYAALALALVLLAGKCWAPSAAPGKRCRCCSCCCS